STAKPALDSPALAPLQPGEADGDGILLSQGRLQLAPTPAGDPSKLLIARALFGADPKSLTSGAVLNLLQEALQEIPRAAGNATAIIISPDGRNKQGTVSANTPPPFRGALPSAQAVAAPSIAPNASPAATVHHLLDDTDAAIARQTLLQVA